jgi:hypothetical protein
MAEERKELNELREKMEKIERMLERVTGAPTLSQTTPVGRGAPWEELINRARPPHPDPYHLPPDIYLAKGQQWIYNELLQIRSLVEEILKEVKK